MTSTRPTNIGSRAKGIVDDASSLTGLETNIGINNLATASNHKETNLLQQLATSGCELYLVVISPLLSISSVLDIF